MTSIASDLDPGMLGCAVGEAYKDFCAGFRSLLSAVAEHDRTESYKAIGVRSEWEWLARVFDVDRRTATDWTRQARLVAARPEIGDRFAAGEVSVDKLRAIAALVDLQQPEAIKPKGPFDNDDVAPVPPPPPPPDPEDGADPGPEPEPDRPLSLGELVARLEELNARQVAAKLAEARAEEARRRERWRTRHVDLFRFDGEARLSIRNGALFDDDAAVFMAAVDDYVSRCGINPETGQRDPLGMRYADALRAMADAYHAQRERALGHPLVVFHTDARVLAGDDEAWAFSGADHSPISVETIRRLACFSRVTLAADDPDGNPLFLGRTQRLASWQQERMIDYRDGGCRGCGSTVGLEYHHLCEWTAQFGLTNIDELVAGCRRCHHLIHDYGWRMDGHPNEEIRLLDPDGVVRYTSRPHPRFERRPRPPRDWSSPPPDQAAETGGAVDPTHASESATLW